MCLMPHYFFTEMSKTLFKNSKEWHNRLFVYTHTHTHIYLKKHYTVKCNIITTSIFLLKPSEI